MSNLHPLYGVIRQNDRINQKKNERNFEYSVKIQTRYQKPKSLKFCRKPEIETNYKRSKNKILNRIKEHFFPIP